MTTRPWHRSAAAVLVAPMLLVVVMYDLAWWFSDSSGAGTGRLTSVIAQAQPALSLGCVFVATSGAASGLAFHRTGLAAHPSARSRARIVLAHLAPTLALGLSCWITCVVISLLYNPIHDVALEPLTLIVVQFTCITACALFGFGLGGSRLGSASLAVVPFLCFLIFGFVEKLPLRFGSAVSGGDFSYCCGPAESISPGALAATTLFFAAMLLASIAMLCTASVTGGRFRLITSTGAAIAMAASVTIGTLTPFPALSPRPGNPDCVQVEGSRICLWPEQHHQFPAAPEEIADLASRLRDHGVAVPTTITGSLTDPHGLHYTRTPTSADSAHRLLIAALMSTDGSCGTFDENASPALLSEYNLLAAWLYRAGGLDSEPIETMMSDAEGERWNSFSSTPAAQQSEWVNNYISALHSCSPSAPDLPIKNH